MMIKEYITSRMSMFGVTVSDTDLLAMFLASPLDVYVDEVTSDNINLCNMAMIEFIPSLLMRANSINESGFSMSWDVGGLKDYYSMMCRKYGVDDTLSDKPKIEIY